MSQGVRVLTAKFKWDNIPTYSVTDNFIDYEGEALSLTLERKNDLYNSIPDIFKNDKEKISRFIVTRRLDNNNSYEYLLEVKRTVYNYRTREHVQEIRDISNVYTDHQFSLLRDYFYNKFTEYYLNDFGDVTDQLYNSVDKNINVAKSIIDYRNQLLSSSDKYMLPDYPISDTEREEWKIYRQKLRDLTEQENWPSNVISISFPAPPTSRLADQQLKVFLSSSDKIRDLIEHQITFNSEIESQVEIMCQRLVEMTVKLDILDQFSKINVPGFDFNDGYFKLQGSNSVVSIEKSDDDPYDKFTTVFDHIESKLIEIDAILESANYTWRVSDVLNRVIQAAEDQVGPDAQEATEIIEGL